MTRRAQPLRACTAHEWGKWRKMADGVREWRACQVCGERDIAKSEKA